MVNLVLFAVKEKRLCSHVISASYLKSSNHLFVRHKTDQGCKSSYIVGKGGGMGVLAASFLTSAPVPPQTICRTSTWPLWCFVFDFLIYRLFTYLSGCIHNVKCYEVALQSHVMSIRHLYK